MKQKAIDRATALGYLVTSATDTNAKRAWLRHAVDADVPFVMIATDPIKVHGARIPSTRVAWSAEHLPPDVGEHLLTLALAAKYRFVNATISTPAVGSGAIGPLPLAEAEALAGQMVGKE